MVQKLQCPAVCCCIHFCRYPRAWSLVTRSTFTLNVLQRVKGWSQWPQNPEWPASPMKKSERKQNFSRTQESGLELLFHCHLGEMGGNGFLDDLLRLSFTKGISDFSYFLYAEK